MKLTNLITATFLALSLAMASCASEEPLIDPSKEIYRSYEFSMGDSQNELNFSIADVSGTVKSIDSPFDWLKITQTANDDMGFPRINIARTKPTPQEFESGDAYLHLSDDKIIKVTIVQRDIIMPSDDNDGDYEAFNSEWWNQKEILYTVTTRVNGKDQENSMYIPLPWADATSSHIPESLFKGDGISHNAGWEMAYNLFSATTDGHKNSYPYFALYNIFTGTLRVFYYQKEGVGTGGELSFAVIPDDASSPKFPFYNSLQYGIPICNTEIPKKRNVLSNSPGSSVFQQLYTPYIKNSFTLNPGWYCFDIDLSAYNPGSKSSFDKDDKMSIEIMTSSNSSMTLSGSFDGKSSGTIENLVNTSTSSGKGKNIIDILKPEFGNVKATIDAVKKGDYLTAVFKGGLSIYNIVKSVSSKGGNANVPAPEPPTIELSHTGEINLNGYTTSSTSSEAASVTFSYNAFAQSDNIGQGIWSLMDNPVVYVVNSVILGEKNEQTLVVDRDGYLLGPEDPKECNLRLITFFDPTSLKVKINERVRNKYSIDNVRITYTYGVYPNQLFGHTDVYKKDLLDYDKKGLIAEPVFIDKEPNLNKVYKSSSSRFANMRYEHVPIESVSPTAYNSSDQPRYYDQKGAKFQYYGCPGNSLDPEDPNFFVVDPVVLLPCDYKINDVGLYENTKIYDFKAPDFVVGVMLTFDYTAPDGTTKTASFSKRFIPTVVSISAGEASKKFAEMQEYLDSKMSLEDGFLAHWPDTDTFLRRAIKTLEKTGRKK